MLIRAAREAGIDRIVVTHPTSNLVNMSIETQQDAARLGALLEYPISLMEPIGETSLEDFAAQIRAVGPRNVILSTDLGQAGNPVHTDGLLNAVVRLLGAGISQHEMDLMIRENPARLLGLSP